MASSPKVNITFTTEATARPLNSVIDLAKEETKEATANSGRTIIVFLGRSRRMANDSLSGELKVLTAVAGSSIDSSSVAKTLGDVGAALVAAGVGASLLVVQASA